MSSEGVTTPFVILYFLIPLYEIQVWFLPWMNEDNSNNKIYQYFLIIQITFYCKIMSSFSFWIIKRTISFTFRWSGYELGFFNTNRIYFQFLNKQHIERNCWIILFKSFPAIFYRRVIYSFPVLVIYKTLNFWFSLRFFSYFFMNYCNYCSIFKTFITIDKIYCCFFVFYPVRRNYTWSTNPPHFRLILWPLKCNKLRQSKIKPLHYINIWKPLETQFDIYKEVTLRKWKTLW